MLGGLRLVQAYTQCKTANCKLLSFAQCKKAVAMQWTVLRRGVGTAVRPTGQWADAARTDRCGQLRAQDVGRNVVLGGWMLTPRRISKYLAFVPLQDATGVVQLVLHASDDAAEQTKLDTLCQVPLESVLNIRGHVNQRAQGAENPNMPTGQIEVQVQDWQVLNHAQASLPFYPSQCLGDLPKESLRAKHRYLDLRRSDLRSNIRTRSSVAHAARCFLHDRGFTEVETPALLRSTPEGAREFLVPTRTAQSQKKVPTFYALQQSPQQPKQLLMASGVTDAYYQFAKCFRDEDGRKDRQPEFTQLDLEMSFVSGAGDSEPTSSGFAWRIGGQEVRDVVEGLVRSMWAAAGRKPELLPPSHFPVLPYERAMSRYGSDKPDLRFGLEIADLTAGLCGDKHAPGLALDVLVLPHQVVDGATLKLSGRQVDQALIQKSGSRSQVEHFKGSAANLDTLASTILRKSRHVATVLRQCAQPPEDVNVGMLSAALRQHVTGASIFAPEHEQHGAQFERCDVFLSVREQPPQGGSTEAGDLRLRLGRALAEQYPAVYVAEPRILWVTEFPLFTRSDEEKNEAAHGRWSSSHHPFTAPAAQDVEKLLEALGKDNPVERDACVAAIHGQHYDLVLDGQEIAGGSVRVHDADLQELMFRKILELSDDETHRFSHLLQALRAGAPPHAGIALGFDRLMAIFCDTPSIRDVIAFPKNTAGSDPLFGSPAPLSEDKDADRQMQDQLALYGLQRN